MVNVGDMGKDYEHGLQLLRKLNEFRGAGSGVRGAGRWGSGVLIPNPGPPGFCSMCFLLFSLLVNLNVVGVFVIVWAGCSVVECMFV